MHRLFILFLFLLPLTVSSQKSDLQDAQWSYHFQLTGIEQYHPSFSSPYSGTNSLSGKAEDAFSLTSTFYLGKKLWKGGEFYFNPEVAGGKGLSYAVGAAGALNGETFRVGDPAPVPFIARAFYRQHIALKNTEYEYSDDGANQLAAKVPTSRIVITAGKFAISDFFDNNHYAHDPRTQFFNWALMSNGAWDYPANTRGYTSGIILELIKSSWALRIGEVVPPRKANGSQMDYNFPNAHSETAEFEKKIRIKQRSGSLRFLGSAIYSKAPSYAQGMDALKTGDSLVLGVIKGDEEWSRYGGKKICITFNLEQELSDALGLFARIGWNDGKYATWIFTEIDRSATLGFVLNGTKWKRPDDKMGLAGIINAISPEHRDFLAAGGYGFIIGDGRLNYDNEEILEAYYSAKLAQTLWVTLDYQFVAHPAYNADRGPVHVIGLRAHVEF